METKKGFIKMILVIVIALIILGVMGYNIKDIINSPTVHDNLQYVWNFVVFVWNSYLAGPVIYIWNTFVVGVLWKLLQAGMGVK